jgi:hypothetical protein
MALVHDNQVEESGRRFPMQLVRSSGPGYSLVERQVHLVQRVDAPLSIDGDWQLHLRAIVSLDHLATGAQLGHAAAERPEVVDHRLVGQDGCGRRGTEFASRARPATIAFRRNEYEIAFRAA